MELRSLKFKNHRYLIARGYDHRDNFDQNNLYGYDSCMRKIYKDV